MDKIHRLARIAAVFSAFCVFIFAGSSWAVDYHGRITIGGFNSVEKHEEDVDGQDSNDFRTISSRFYLDLSRITRHDFGLAIDVRDKHDFFDKLDREKRELSERNTMQVQQFALKYNNPSGHAYGQLGRLTIPQAGHSYVDGLNLGFRWSRAFDTGLFGGLNPKRPDQNYMKYNEDSYNYGYYFNYEPKDRSWSRIFYTKSALVSQQFKTEEKMEEDRRYFYNNTFWQWGYTGRAYSLLYYDFVPRPYVQYGYMNIQNRIMKGIDTSLGLSKIDVIEYQRRQGLREQLDPSPYREGRMKTRIRVTRHFHWHTLLRYGKREADGLERKEGHFDLRFPRALSKRLDSHIKLGYRNQFTNKGPSAQAGIGYFTKRWEFTLDVESAVEEQADGETLHPLLTEVSAANQISKKYFQALSVQYAKDEKVEVFSVFFKVGLRFGNKELAPLRDGAAPRGRL